MIDRHPPRVAIKNFIFRSYIFFSLSFLTLKNKFYFIVKELQHSFFLFVSFFLFSFCQFFFFLSFFLLFTFPFLSSFFLTSAYLEILPSEVTKSCISIFKRDFIRMDSWKQQLWINLAQLNKTTYSCLRQWSPTTGSWTGTSPWVFWYQAAEKEYIDYFISVILTIILGKLFYFEKRILF